MQKTYLIDKIIYLVVGIGLLLLAVFLLLCLLAPGLCVTHWTKHIDSPNTLFTYKEETHQYSILQDGNQIRFLCTVPWGIGLYRCYGEGLYDCSTAHGTYDSSASAPADPPGSGFHLSYHDTGVDTRTAGGTTVGQDRYSRFCFMGVTDKPSVATDPTTLFFHALTDSTWVYFQLGEKNIYTTTP